MQKRNLSLIRGLIIGVILGIIVVVVIRNNNQAHVIKVGYSPLLLNMPIMVATELHCFDSVGISVDLVEMPSTNNMRDAVTNGNIDIAVALGTEMFVQNNIIQNGSLKALFFNVLTKDRYVDAIIVKNDCAATDITDLNGKNIGCYPASTVQAYLNTISQKKGVSFNIITVNPDEAMQLLESGRIDALYAMEPTLTYALKTNRYKEIETALAVRNIQNYLPVGVWAVNNKFCDNNPQKLKLFCKAINMSMEFIEHDPDSAKVLSARFLKKERNEFDNSHYPEWKDGCFYSEINSMNKFLAFLVQYDIITAPSDQSENMICIKK